jgi:hypothetical protein
VPIKSIELQLVRVETCGCAEGYSKDCTFLIFFFGEFYDELEINLITKVTEIQNVQIGEGDVLRGIQIPIYMIFPRLFTCPTLLTTNFKIGIKNKFMHNKLYNIYNFKYKRV